MASDSPQFPSPVGSFWLPALTPETSPLLLDDFVGLPELELNSLKQFSTPSVYTGSPVSDPIPQVDAWSEFPMQVDDEPSDEAPVSAVSEVVAWREFSTPSDNEPSDEASVDIAQLNAWRKFSTPPDNEPSDEASMDLASQVNAWRKFSTPPDNEPSDEASMDLASQVNAWREFSTPSDGEQPDDASMVSALKRFSTPSDEEDSVPSRWKRFSSPSDEENSVVGWEEIPEQGVGRWKRFSTPSDDNNHDIEGGDVQRQGTPSEERITISREESPDAIEIRSSPPMTLFRFPVIPDSIAAIQLPLSGSVLDLARIQVVPPSLCKRPCCIPRLVAKEVPKREEREVINILRTLPCPSKENLLILEQKWAESRQQSAYAVEIHHSPSPILLPDWVLTFWEPVASHWNDITWWRKAYNTLTTHVECAELVDLLSTVPWRYRSPVAGAEICDLAALATTEWLTDNHMNLLTWYYNQRLRSSEMTFLGPAYPTKIRDLYNASQSGVAPAMCRWLDSRRAALLDGTLHEIGFCLHTEAGKGLPTTERQGNHWVAVVLDGRNRRIWFGDSLGYDPHPSVLDMLDWWLKPAFNQKFSIHSLNFNRQCGTWSCGDHAMNMIAHHFAPQRFRLLGDTLHDEVFNRMQLLVRIVHDIRAMPGSDFIIKGGTSNRDDVDAPNPS